MKEVDIESGKNLLRAILFEAHEPRTILIIAPATGVKQTFYKKIATYLSSRGVNVITFDYSGIGDSLKGSIKDIDVDAADWGRHDLENVLKYSLEHYPNLKKVFLGHSIGGQLSGIAPSILKMDKIILIAAQAGYWKHWSGIGRMRMWTNWHILFPPLFSAFGYLPSKKISGMENLPKEVAAQWSRWGRNKDYLLSSIRVEDTYYSRIQVPITSIRIEGDRFAPKPAVDWLEKQFDQDHLQKITLTPAGYQVKEIGHFGVFREKFSDSIWPEIEKLINKIE